MPVRVPPRPAVTIAIVPRERFSHTLKTIASLYAQTPPPFELIVVDGHPPVAIRAALDEEARRRGFRLIRCAEAVSPNRARNLALAQTTTPYIVFADNDLLFTPGWLDALIACAEETGAEAVGPIYLFDAPEKGQVHMAGGRFLWEDAGGERLVDEVHLHSGRPLAEVRPLLRRGPCDFVEFHCMLVRRAVFDRTGPLDEAYLSTAEHLDFALALRQAGGRTFLAPDAVVGYMAHAGYTLADLDYFRLRWSDDWNGRSLARFREKWGVAAESPFFETHLSWLAGHQVYIGLPRLAEGAGWQPAPHGYAQTNIQLYNQIEALGWPAADLHAVGEAYALAARLFGGLLRANGKPFLAHAAGVASILAAHGASLLTVRAGLLHAAYTHGAFAGQPAGMTPEKRAALESAIGRNAERIVAAYTVFDWSAAHAATLAEGIDELPVDTGNLLFMRLAILREAFLDRGMVHAAQVEHDAVAWLPVFAAVADRLKVAPLAAELEQAIAEYANEPLPSPVRTAFAESVPIQPARLVDPGRPA